MKRPSSPRVALSAKNLPRSVPLLRLAVFALVLDRLAAPAWLWGAAGVVAVACLAYSVYDYFTAVDVEIGSRTAGLDAEHF